MGKISTPIYLDLFSEADGESSVIAVLNRGSFRKGREGVIKYYTEQLSEASGKEHSFKREIKCIDGITIEGKRRLVIGFKDEVGIYAHCGEKIASSSGAVKRVVSFPDNKHILAVTDSGQLIIYDNQLKKLEERKISTLPVYKLVVV